MPKYTVGIQHTIETSVTVEADTPEAAIELVDRRSFPLPSRDEWEGQKDYEYNVSDQNGTELIDWDGETTEDHPANTFNPDAEDAHRLHIDIDTVIDSQRGEIRASEAKAGDAVREFDFDDWYDVVSVEGDGDTVTLNVTPREGPTAE